MPVIQPYMTPRTYASLDLFSTYWGAYTGARSAKHKMMLELELKALDDDGISDTIKDLQRRRADLDKSIGSLTQKELLEQSKTERRTSKTDGGDALARAKFIQQANVASDRSRRAERDALAREMVRVDEKELEENEQTDRYKDNYARSRTNQSSLAWQAGQAANAEQGNTQGEIDQYTQRIAAIEDAHPGTRFELEREAHLKALYDTAVDNGHTEAADQIRIQAFKGRNPAHVDNKWMTTKAEQDAYREERRALYGTGGTISAKEAMRRAEAGGAGTTTKTTTETTKGSATATDTVYGPELDRLEAERLMVDMQLQALLEARLGAKAAGMNAIQQRMSMNWNFAPFALAPDRPAQEFIDRMAEEDPRRLVETMEAKEEYGTYGRMMRAQQEGETGVFDPVRATTVDEYASTDPGSYVMAHFYEKLKEAEGMKPSQQVAALTSIQSDMLAMSGAADQLDAMLRPLYDKIENLMTDGAVADYTGQAYYRTIEGTGTYTYRQYLDGAIEVTGAPPEGAHLVGALLTEGPGWRALTDEAEKIGGKLERAKLDGFATGTRGGEPLPEAVMVDGISDAAETARAGMGANDVLFSQAMSSMLMGAMAEDDPNARLRAIHDVGVKAEAMDDSLTGGQHTMLAQRMELRAAEGDLQSLLDDVDRIIDAGADRARMDREFKEYMLEYGDVIDRQGVPTGIREGVPRSEDERIDLERQAERVRAEEEAEIERELRALRPDAGYQDPALPRLTQGDTRYQLPEGERARLRGLRKELDELEEGAEAWRGTMAPQGQERIAELKAEIEKVEAGHERLRAGGTLDVGEIAPGPIEAEQTRRGEEARAQSEEAMDMLASRYGVPRGGGELTYDPVEVLKVFTDAGIQMDESLLDQVFELAPEETDLLKAVAAEKQHLRGLRATLDDEVLIEAAQ